MRCRFTASPDGITVLKYSVPIRVVLTSHLMEVLGANSEYITVGTSSIEKMFISRDAHKLSPQPIQPAKMTF